MEKGLKKKIESNTTCELDEEQAGPSTAQQVTVKFKSTDDKWKERYQNSYKSLLAKSAEEPWTECSWYKSDSTECEVSFNIHGISEFHSQTFTVNCSH